MPKSQSIPGLMAYLASTREITFLAVFSLIVVAILLFALTYALVWLTRKRPGKLVVDMKAAATLPRFEFRLEYETSAEPSEGLSVTRSRALRSADPESARPQAPSPQTPRMLVSPSPDAEA